MENLYKGTGDIKDYEHSLEFLNWVFFSDDPEENRADFLSFLPKLYKKEYNHCEKNLIVADSEKWLAAVGLYIEDMDICGEKFLCGGIGNVAVSKDARGKGYMKDCMRLAAEKCYEENVDFMVLGGQRQRYSYFGFEPACIEYEYCLNDINIRHNFGRDYISPLTAQSVGENDTEALDFIFELYNKTFDARILRKREKLYDTLVSWNQKPFVFSENGRFIGYVIYSECKGYIMESAAVSDEYFKLMLPAVLKASGKGSVHVKQPAFVSGYNQTMSDICEGYTLNHSDLVNILNWKHTVGALLKLKSKHVILADGEISFLIHGFKKDELFTLKVKNNEVTVTDGGESPIELSHREAMQVFTGLYSDRRGSLPAFAAQWLPLELMIFSADTV